MAIYSGSNPDGYKFKIQKAPDGYSLFTWFDNGTGVYNWREKHELNYKDAYKLAQDWLANKLAKNPRKSAGGDETAAQELFLFISNHSDLYRQMIEPIMKNLSLKKLKGIYDHTKALKLWANLAAAGAKLYNVEFGSGKATLAGFDVATRLLAADKLQDYYEDMIDPSNWAGQRGFKTVTARNNPRLMSNQGDRFKVYAFNKLLHKEKSIKNMAYFNSFATKQEAVNYAREVSKVMPRGIEMYIEILE